MVHTIEIKKESWPEFFRTLNHRAVDQPIRLEVEGPELGDQQLGRRLVFREISAETKGSEEGDLLITVETEGGALTHHVDHPVRLYAIFNESAELDVVMVEQADQSKTLIHFEHLPEMAAETHPS